MVDVHFVPRTRWRRARWRIVGSSRVRKLLQRPQDLARRVWRCARRVWGLVAFALLIAGGSVLYFGKGAAGVSPIRHFNAMAVDGDTLRVGGQRIPLIGIDAPELSQSCRDEHGRHWLCGSAAHARLRSLVGLGLVECISSSVDRYGRPLAVCSAGTVPDIGEAMVRAGYAVSFMSPRYWLAELEARYHKRGLWSGSFVSPANWRNGHRDSG